MSVDISKIKVGDKIVVMHETIVTEAPCEGYVGATTVDGLEAEYPYNEIVGHTPAPRPIKAGDRVKTACEGVTYRVVAVDGDSVWLCGDTARYWTAPLSTLEYVDEA